MGGTALSTVYEAVVFEGDASAVRAYVECSQTKLSHRLFQASDLGFVLICWHPDNFRRHAVEEVNLLAADLSGTFGAAIAIHYDDRCAIRTAVFYQAGSMVRDFGEADEIWSPIDSCGYPGDGPRYSGDAIPEDLECDCIQQAIDVGLETAGFGGWLTATILRDWALGTLP